MSIKMPAGMSMLIKTMGIDPDALAGQAANVMESVQRIAAHLESINSRLSRIEKMLEANGSGNIAPDLIEQERLEMRE